MELLKIESCVKKFGGLTAVNRCSFSVAENSITALIGPNGAGKTTMFDLISGFLESDEGRILFRGEEIQKLAPHMRARRGIARTFQALRLFPQLSALENIILALPENRGGLSDIFKPLKKRHRALSEKAHDYLKKINLEDKAHTKAGALSYGQQKLLEIIRAVATDAPLLMLDEPAAGVNRTMLHHIVQLIKDLHAGGKTIFIIEHDMGFVMELSQRVIVMDYGKEIAEGTPHEIQNNPAVLEAYLGKKHIRI